MFYIVASYYSMQFQRKPINQTWENGEKPTFAPDFGSFDTNFVAQIAASYHCMQCQGKLMIATQENGKKPHFGLDLGLLGSKLGHRIFFPKIWFSQSLDIMVSYHHIQYQKKLTF